MTIAVYEVVGTNCLFDVSGQAAPSLYDLYKAYGYLQMFLNGSTAVNSADTYMGTNLHPALFDHVLIPYPAGSFWIGQSVSVGVSNAISAINGRSGSFALLGWGSQGGLVASNVYDQIRTGSLTSRSSDLIAGMAFGNPRRQSGHTFPLCADPGGEGALANDLLTSSETRWFEFANPNDPVSCNNSSTAEGAATAQLYELLVAGTAGSQLSQSSLSSLLAQPVWTVASSVAEVTQVFNALGIAAQTLGIPLGTPPPHMAYGAATPLAPADTRTSVQIAIDYLNAVALGWNAATTAPTATALAGGEATVMVAEPTVYDAYTYSVTAFDVTTNTASPGVLNGAPAAAGGNVTIPLKSLTPGDTYTFSVQLGTTLSSPTVAPTSMASNPITALAGTGAGFPYTLPITLT